MHVLVSFATTSWSGTRQRFEREAANMKVFDRLQLYDEHSSSIHVNEPESKGYGFYAWKPQAILEASKTLQNGDIIVWADIGCSFNASARKRMLEYFDIARRDKVLLFKTCHKEEHYTKRDLLGSLECDASFMNTTQIAATAFVISLCDETRGLLQECATACSVLSNVNETVSVLSPHLRQHRHDQSVFSLLCKKRGFKPHNDETQVWNPMRFFVPWPIAATRIRGTVKN
jgi:hypothetical protein